MSSRMRPMFLALAGCLCFSLPTLAQTKPVDDTDRLQKQCDSIEDYSRLSPAQAKECEAWDKQQDEERAQIHAGGIEEADKNAEDAATNAAATVKPLLAKLTPAQHIAYARLLTAFQAFMSVQVSGGELYFQPYSGVSLNGGGDFAAEYLRASFDTAVIYAIHHRTELPGLYDEPALDGQPSTKPPISFKEADTKLNQAWQHLVSRLRAAQMQEQLDRLQKEQRAWLAFRDRFASFAVTVSPNLSRSVWLASLEANRAEELVQVDTILAADSRKYFDVVR